MPDTGSPESVSEVSSFWWEQVFDGRLWRVEGRLIPGPKRRIPNQEFDKEFELFQSFGVCQSFRYAAYYQARSRGLRLSAMIRPWTITVPALYEPTSAKIWCVYLQAFPKDVVIREQRTKDRRRALPAPPMPRDTGTRRRSGPVVPDDLDYSEVIERLLAGQEGSTSVPSAALTDHTQLGWYLSQCTCGTLNFRTHEKTCRIYPLLAIMEKEIGRLTMAPERWVAQYRPERLVIPVH